MTSWRRLLIRSAGGHAGLPNGWIIRGQSPIALDDEFEPEPYARARLADYWIVNLVDRVLEIYRDPVPDPSARYEWRYASVRTLTESETVVPLAVPTLHIAVANLLP